MGFLVTTLFQNFVTYLSAKVRNRLMAYLITLLQKLSNLFFFVLANFILVFFAVRIGKLGCCTNTTYSALATQ